MSKFHWAGASASRGVLV